MIRRRSRPLSDAGVVAVAAAAGAGAWLARPVPLGPVAVVAVVALLARRPVLLGVAVAALASGLGAQAVAGARPPPAGPVTGRALLVSDPAPVAGAVLAEVRMAGRHYDLWARGGAGAVLRTTMAGQEVQVTGAITPRGRTDAALLARHVVGRISAERLERRGRGTPVAQVANGARAVLERGASVLSRDQRTLFSGFVLGDTRDESPATEDDFQGAGLGHLLVVSGENVAFVLAAVAPAVRRLGPRGRWAATVGVLGLFAVMTRFEPSVLRATVMAAVAVTAWVRGRPMTGIRILALCVAALILLDPFLVARLGFRLSVAAAAGILVLARPLAAALPLPAPLASLVAVTTAAQLGVAPLLVGQPGGLAVVALPANVLAEPAAAAVMAWGLTAGVVAGLVGGPVATVAHGPTRVLLWWVASVARAGAHLGLGDLTPATLVVAVGVGAAAFGAHRLGRRRLSGLGWVLAAVVLVAPAARAGDVPVSVAWPGVGTLWRSHPAGGAGGTVLVLEAGARPVEVLRQLRRAGVGRIDLVVVPRATRSTEALVAIVGSRVAVGEIWAPVPGPPGSPPGRATTPLASAGHPRRGDQVDVGGLHLAVTADEPGLAVDVTVTAEQATGRGVGSPRAPRARSPPLRCDPPRPRHGHLEPDP